jgi:hypothetical protein
VVNTVLCVGVPVIGQAVWLFADMPADILRKFVPSLSSTPPSAIALVSLLGLLFIAFEFLVKFLSYGAITGLSLTLLLRYYSKGCAA